MVLRAAPTLRCAPSQVNAFAAFASAGLRAARRSPVGPGLQGGAAFGAMIRGFEVAHGELGDADAALAWLRRAA